MARKQSMRAPKLKSKTSKALFTVPPVPRTGLFAFLAAFAGIVAAVPLTIAVMMPTMRQDVASAVSAANSKRVAIVAPADDTLACTPPSVTTAGVGGSGGGHVLGANTAATPPAGGQGGGGGQSGGTTTVYVHKLVNGVLKSSGSISNTGPGSSNSITTTQTATTTVTNDNDIDVNNVNLQHSSTGDADVSHNTTGGAATTGDASNTNSTNLSFNISN